jgi:thiosulfate dehydrogenase
MNCQNCHLDAGTKAYGNNFGMVASTYPKYRERSGSVESIYKRINDCMQRSLNGKALDTTQAEIQAMRAYILWLGKGIVKEHKPKGTGITELAYMDRATDPLRGKTIYEKQCQSCHQMNGSGIKTKDSVSYQYPPLWGEHSYNVGAGLYRLSRLAGYVRSNMPLGTSYDQPALSEEDAWDVAAYINSQPRPVYDLSHDWPRIAAKPVDHPFGPYADTFSAQQHKYGPYAAMVKRSKEKK